MDIKERAKQAILGKDSEVLASVAEELEGKRHAESLAIIAGGEWDQLENFVIGQLGIRGFASPSPHDVSSVGSPDQGASPSQ